MISIAVVLAAVIAHANAFSTSDCTLFDSHMGATFSLSEATKPLTQAPYIIEDGDVPCTPQVEQNFTYYFNVCGTISTANIPDSCFNDPLTASQLPTAGALQVNKYLPSTSLDDACYLAGSFNDQTTLKLINPDDPTQGIVLTYTGNPCRNKKKRLFHIELTCADKMNPVPTHALELTGCEYTATIPSVYGCPLECPVAKRSLCGGQGHCAYDYDAHSARCFCNHGYSGSDCTETTSSTPLNYSPALLGIIITLFIIIAVLAITMYLMIRQVSAYKDDMRNYQALRGGDDEAQL